MIKKSIFFFTLWTLSHAYISRMALTRMRAPVAFRPGVVLPRPVYPPRMMSPATRRAPFVLYRNPPHRYAMKHINTSPSRHIYSPWKTTRIPIPVATPEYEFARAAPSSPIIHPDGRDYIGKIFPSDIYIAVGKDNSVQSCLTVGAIHTIPAPNLSLSEKPIIVADAAESTAPNEPSEGPKPTYEVTEKYADQPNYQVNPKIETPIGFSKASSMSAADLQNIVRHNAALQLASEYGFPAIQLSQPTVQLPSTIIPQQFTMQGFHGLTNPHEFMHRGPEQIIIQPNALYQPDPMFLQKLQSQILQQYPVEFVPYTPSTQHEIQTQPPETQTSLYLLQNEQLTKEEPPIEHKEDNKNIVQRETQENAVSSIIPHAFSFKNVSENLIDIDISTVPQNITEILETEAPTTTVRSIENPEDHKTTPIYYAQIGQSVGNVIANGFYSAINDVRASIEENHTNKLKLQENITTTTVPTTTQREIKSLFQNNIKKDSRLEDFKNLLGSPFEKTAESVNVAYTILRANEKESKVNKDGEVFAGQLVEAKISEDQEFNKEKANLASRPPLRLYAVTEKVEAPPQRTIVKAKIPPKSKLIFDDKTGEPVLRVYASYLDNTAQKELLTAKLSNMKYKEASRKQDNVDIKELEKSLIGDVNHAQFGLKLKSRSDDYIPIFDEYDD